MIYPNSDKITYKYDIRRLLESVTDERGKLTTYTFDTAYRLTHITDALSHTREYDYDLMSNLKFSKDALGNQTDYKYDDFNRLKEIEYPLPETGATRLKELFEYDTVGRIKKVTDTANRITNYAYDDASRTNTVTNAELETTTIKYNARGYTTEVKDALNQTYTFTPDALGRVTAMTRAGGTMTYEYDTVGNRTKRIDYIGRRTDYTYDKLNRLTKIEYGLPDVLQPTVTYTYDDISQLKTATNENGTVSFNYDNRNRMINTTDVFGHIVAYEYERTATVNQQRLKFDGALYASYNFDDANRLSNIVNAADSSTISFGYDNANRLTSRIYPNGITTTYDYDGMSRLKRLKDTSPTATLYDRQYGYNSASQINQITEPSQSRTFGYDFVNRLTSMTNGTSNENYSYDDVGNRLSSHRSASYGYQTGQFNRVASTATANYSYDANGNMTTKAEGKDLWRYGWDYENRVASASTRKETVLYRYDALGRRIQRHFKGNKEKTKFIYDGNDVLADDNDGTLTKYINGAGIDDKLRQTTGSTASYFLADHLGSTNGLTDSSGNLTSSANYDSFGNATGNLSTRYQFTGREFDNFTGLNYYRARWYDANLGRFISEDPIGFAGGDANLYGYVWNNPQGFTDPSGLQGNGWGNDLADWGDENVNYARGYWKADSQWWFWNGSVDTAADLASGFCDLFRVGSGVGYAIYAEDENIYGRGAFILMDIGRGAGIATLVIGSTAPKFSSTPSWGTRPLFGRGGKTGGGIVDPCALCFEADTQIQTDEGLKPIEKIEAGDKVLSYNENTGFLEYQEVLQKFTRYADDIYSVSVEGESKPLNVTSEHPFFVRVYRARDNLFSADDDGEWRETQNLQIGDEIRLANGSWAKVLSVQFKGAGQVYNFTVAKNHNYFVGDLRLLTHNECNLNTNSAQGNFGVYEITVDGQLIKYGKADLNRVTQSTGLPTRLHQQVRKLQTLNPDSAVTGNVVHKLPGSTTKQIKAIENSYIQRYYDNNGVVPKGNQRSFRP